MSTPNTTRRAFLGAGLSGAAALAAGAAVTLPAMAADPADHALLAMEPALRAAAEKLDISTGVLGDAEERFYARRPKAPNLLMPGTYSAYKDAVKVYEEQILALRAECGLTAAEARQEEVAAEHDAIADAIFEMRATTFAGIAFKLTLAEVFGAEPVVESLQLDLAGRIA